MKYLYCVGIPLILQILVVYIIIELNTGNGSWIGLAAFLLAIPVVPLTIIINSVRTNLKTQIELPILFLQSLLVGIAVPIIVVALFVITTIIEGIF